MNINQLIFRNLKKNVRNYYLYVFALIFSVALYFSFVTLQYDPSLDATKGTIKGAAAIKAASIMLIVIVAVFLVYANNLFIKRRSKEIGLFQLIGMTKGQIIKTLGIENILLYFASMAGGIFIGFAMSRLVMMIFLKLTGIEAVASLRFSTEALIQTLIVFSCIYIFVMIINAIFIKRQTILTLFQVRTSTENKVKRLSFIQIIIGMLGIGLIAFGYYLSTRLFSGDFVGMNSLFIAMALILGSVIFGTYLFYKGSISFLFNLIRKKKNGYLKLNEVLSLSSIMFRMKSNALLLTIITTVSALAIGLLALTYISYYSAEKTAEQSIPHHFSIPNEEHASTFQSALDQHQIDYSTINVDLLELEVDLSDIIDSIDELNVNFDPGVTTMIFVSDEATDNLDVSPSETVFINSNDAMQQFISFKDSGNIALLDLDHTIELDYLGVEEKFILPTRITGGFPTAVIDNQVYHQVKENLDQEALDNTEFPVYVGIDIDRSGELETANEIFQQDISKWAAHESQIERSQSQKQSMGLTMFIVGFLGLTFLITSGCILYFKQMDEGDEEKPNYTILRKLGFTQYDLLKGIQVKQLFNFGIPLIVGLSHSYFAVESGWFFFGTEMWTPMVIVMLLYTALYSVFGILSVFYYKKVIKESL
ncbi:bacitracin transport system permease protein [Oceanobacillus limi]|uniref:Bacitracin transport system permease protein n=1 Tax=Oceanobacillus limi TaxID=930131 RepID=A0A1I0CST0_9BACI|nr:FtsX-like permease family protein [Oceanobacillus limi]SET22771.1 bacitracin transport system permease protein [Oceanobacillus limi]